VIYNTSRYRRYKLRLLRSKLYGLMHHHILRIKSIEECFPDIELRPYGFAPESVSTPEALTMPYHEDAIHLKKDRYLVPTLFTAILRDVYYCSAYNVILNRKKEMVRDSSGTMVRSRYFNLKYFYGVSRRQISGYCASLRSVSNNYYNLLIRNLPRLHALSLDPYKKLKEIQLLVVGDLNPSESYFLPKICPDNVRVTFVEDKHLYDIQTYIYAPFLTQKSAGYLPKSYLKFFHDQVLPKRRRKKTERILVSREDAKTRHMLNEDLLYKKLCKMGFKKYCLEDMSVEDQVQLFYDAESVVATHGAGLTNVIFSERINVLELFPYKFIKPSYYYLCKSMGHKYHYICGDSDWINDDFVVNVPAVCRVIKNTLAG